MIHLGMVFSSLSHYWEHNKAMIHPYGLITLKIAVVDEEKSLGKGYLPFRRKIDFCIRAC